MSQEQIIEIVSQVGTKGWDLLIKSVQFDAWYGVFWLVLIFGTTLAGIFLAPKLASSEYDKSNIQTPFVIIGGLAIFVTLAITGYYIIGGWLFPEIMAINKIVGGN